MADAGNEAAIASPGLHYSTSRDILCHCKQPRNAYKCNCMELASLINKLYIEVMELRKEIQELRQDNLAGRHNNCVGKEDAKYCYALPVCQ